MDSILGSHRIDPTLLRTDDFWEFFAARAEALLQRIEDAMGKQIQRDPDAFRAGAVDEEYPDDPQEWTSDGEFAEEEEEEEEVVTIP